MMGNVNIQREVGEILILALDDEEAAADLRQAINSRVTELAKSVRQIHKLSHDELYIWERVAPFIRGAHQQSCIFERVSDRIFDNIYNRNDAREYLWSIYHLNYTSIPIQLSNAKKSFLTESFVRIIGRNTSDKVCNAFESCFPNLQIARDSIVHAHDRNFGLYKNNKIRFDEDVQLRRQMVRAVPVAVELMDPNGATFQFDFSPQRFVELYELILESLAE